MTVINMQAVTLELSDDEYVINGTYDISFNKDLIQEIRKHFEQTENDDIYEIALEDGNFLTKGDLLANQSLL